MAAVNGDASCLDDSRNGSVHLGKRKRSSSLEKADLVNGQDTTSLQQSLNMVLIQSKKSDALLSFLQQQIPTDSSDRPDAKRVRLDSAEPEAHSIEKRILAGAYQSHEDVIKDVDSVRNVFTTSTPNGEVNGDGSPAAANASRDVANQFLRLLKSKSMEESTSKMTKHLSPTHHAGHIIMLRGTTDRGISMLYSGLQSESAENRDLSKDARRLPNGFDLAEPATMDASMLAPTRQARKFGDVFGAHRNTKPLEMPRTRTAFRSNTLGFRSDPFPDRPAPASRQDYKHQPLATSSFLSYARGRALSEQDASRKYRDKHVTPNDFKAALITSDAAIDESKDPLAQFKKAFSSFAPETDSSASVATDRDRDRQWWRKHGADRMRKIFSSSYPEPDTCENTVSGEQTGDNEFAGVVDHIPDEGEDEPPATEEPENIDEVLDEISRLLETVHSYQRMRSLETRPSADTTKPSSDEFDTYEILRSQLAILIASVPPFAVAKLDGDKLSELNISTNIMVEGVDYRGTFQPDDFTLAKYRAAQPPPRVPQTATPAARPTYTPQTTVPRYGGPNLQNYTHNLGVQAQVAQRQAQVQAQQYSTPQNMQRNYQAFSQQAANYTSQQPNLQQFQRPPAEPAHGFGNWTNTAASGTPYTGHGQPPSQPGYQQRAQNQAQQAVIYEAQTPSRSTVNGQMNYQNMPQYQRPSVGMQQGQGQGMQSGMANGGP